MCSPLGPGGLERSSVPVLQGVTAKVLLVLSRVLYPRCSPGHGEHDPFCVSHHMTPSALLSWVWRSVVGWCFMGQS